MKNKFYNTAVLILLYNAHDIYIGIKCMRIYICMHLIHCNYDSERGIEKINIFQSLPFCFNNYQNYVLISYYSIK